MAFGNFIVRVAGSADKSKWKTEIHKTARAALKAARGYVGPNSTHQVCVFDMRKWGAKPVCLEPARWDARRRSGTAPKRSHLRVPYTYAPSKVPDWRPGGKMKRLALDKHGNPVVKLDGYRRRKRRK